MKRVGGTAIGSCEGKGSGLTRPAGQYACSWFPAAIKMLTPCVFFFSSRRRHTRLQGDWSSDVCSSDLVVENTPGVHNLVVCTLCSCYPHALIGLPPTWYKSFEYRSRAVREPRMVLREFGVELPENTEIRIWDSSAELRYLVLPERPAGTEQLSETELADLVTRDSMIGVAVVRPPRAEVGAASRRGAGAE